MTNQELLDCIKAEMDGKKIEKKSTNGYPNVWGPKDLGDSWNLSSYVYRIAPEPKKPEGRWVRVEVAEVGGDWRLKNSVNGWESIANLFNVSGFGGIDYQSPFDPKVIVRSMVPLMFGETSVAYFTGILLAGRPGIPVAAWFWREGEW